MAENRLVRNARVVLGRPAMLRDYAAWTLQRAFAEPTRSIGGIRLGGFNGFSEYHSLPAGVSHGELRFLTAYPLTQGAILDIGANLGLFSLVTARARPDRRILAFEPAPSTFQALRRNVERNRLDVECHQLAVAERDGTATFVVREKARANSSLVSDLVLPGEKRVDIQCTTLDRFVEQAGIRSIALLKIDVEGFEASVLKGAEGVLARMRPPLIYFEVCATLARLAGFAPDGAALELLRHGYRLHRIDEGGNLVPIEPSRAAEVRAENWVATLPQ